MYEVLEYFPNQWASLSGVEARREFRSLMAVRERRVEFLAGTSGIDLDGSDVSFAKLSEWMWSEIEPSPSNAVVPDPYWRSVARDVGLYAGETFIARWPQLKWDLVTSGPTFVDYREPVINGFRLKLTRRDVCLLSFAHACNLLSKDRIDRVDVGDGVVIDAKLGPVEHGYFARVLRRAEAAL